MASKVSSRKWQGKRALGRSAGPGSERLRGETASLPSARPRRELTFFAFLLLLLFVIYNSNLRTVSTFDALPARLLPFSILLDHSLYLDQWIQPHLAELQGPQEAWFAAKSHDHWMSAYPIITPLAVTPLYVLPAWWLSRHSPPLYPHSHAFVVITLTMEKLCASLIAAMSGAVLFLALCKIASRNVSLVVALIYALASNTWTISSQALWRHGLTELSFAFLLWALFRVPDSPNAPFWAGLALAVAATNKPLEAILTVPFMIYFGRRHWKNLLLFLTPLVVLGSLELAYNLHFFARLLGGYPAPAFVKEGGAHLSFWAHLAGGLPGSLVSPNRGLLVYMPWTAFAFWGAAKLWKEKSPAWSRPFILALAAILVVQVTGGDWWGGWCFGPRYLTDLLPFLAWFLVPVLTSLRARPVLRVAFAATVAIALWVQVVGAFYYPAGNWDSFPVSVDVEPRRVWDWSDTQILRSWRAGPAPPILLHEWESMLQPRYGAPPP